MNLCRRGHDKDVVGVRSDGRCLECRKIMRPYGDGPSLRTMRLPVEPLVEVMPTPMIDSYTNSGIKTILPDNLERGYYRARKQGWLTMSLADEICGVLSRHPTEIWGNAWLD